MNKQANSKIIRINIPAIGLLLTLFLAIFLVIGFWNRGPEPQLISVSDLLNKVKANEYSRIEIRDDGQILAQSKYVVQTKITGDDKISVPTGTKVATMETGLQRVSLDELITAISPADPVTQLRNIFAGGNTSRVTEVLLGNTFVIARVANPASADLYLENVGKDVLLSKLADEGIDLNSLGIISSYLDSASVEILTDSFITRLQNSDFATLYDLGDNVIARVKDERIKTYRTNWDGTISAFARILQEENISLAATKFRVDSIITPKFNWDMVIMVGTLILVVVGGYFLLRGIQGSGSGLMKFGQSRARMFWGVKPDISFEDVAGVDESKQELKEIVEFLRNPNKFRKLGARIPKGVLMVGAPGTGKTMLARAIAGEAGVPFFHTSGSEFEEMLVGAGASRVRDLFEKAKKASPALIFIDEIDAVARKRGTTIQSSSTEQTLNQILVEMDGFEQGTNVIVIAATNRPDVLDPAILRPGRFDRRVVLDLPDAKGREQILIVHSKNKPLADDVNLEKVAKRTVGFSGAELENTLNEAAIIAAKNNQKQITAHDIEEAATKVTMGPVRKSLQRTDEELNLVAVHEAGHAIVAKLLDNTDLVHRVSILSRGMAGGVTHFLPQDDNRMMSKTRLLARVAVALGGRAAEEVVLGDISTGASSDINSVTSIVRNMVQKYGMSDKLGLIKYGESTDLEYLGYGYGEQRDYSEETAKVIDNEVRDIVEAQYDRAKNVISKNREKFDKLVEALLQREVLEAEEVEELLQTV